MYSSPPEKAPLRPAVLVAQGVDFETVKENYMQWIALFNSIWQQRYCYQREPLFGLGKVF